MRYSSLMDGRPIALFRILFAAVILKDAVYHLWLAHWFYSDAGIVPRGALFDGLARDARFSLMDMVAHPWQAQLVFLLWIGVVLCLLVGYHVRWMTILNFVFILSIHERNVYILTGADTVIRVFSFWLIFADSGRYYAVDALRYYGSSTTSGAPRKIPALPIWIMRWQFAGIYAVTGLLKLMGTEWLNGEAIFYVLQLESVRLPPGHLLVDAPFVLLQAMTYFTLIAELTLPFLLLLPFGQPWLRGLAFLIGILLHVGIGSTLAIPDFSVLMLVCYVLFFDPRWLIWLEKRLFSSIPQAPAPPPRSLRWARAILPAALLLAMWWNVDSLREYHDDSAPSMPATLIDVTWYSGLWQYWDLFAPQPYRVDGRFVVAGEFENGFRFDLFTQKPLGGAYTIPQFGPQMRWKKFEEVIFSNQHPQILEAWGGYYCLLYNEERDAAIGTRLATLEIQYQYRLSHAPGEPLNPLQTEVMWTHWCYEAYASPAAS